MEYDAEYFYAKSLERKYGMTLDDYSNLYTKQEGRCALCRVHQRDLNYKLNVDHDHKTGEVRGLLCTLCNVNLGEIERTP